MFGATLFLMKNVSLDIMDGTVMPWINLVVVSGTFAALTFTKIRAPYIVAICMALGWMVYQF